MNELLKSKVTTAPKQPGCYLFKDDMGNTIYVGKAKSLHARVRSYFTAAAEKDERIKGLIRQIADVEFLLTPSETDALIEEYRLIKQRKPWFNSQMKRDTPHPFIRIDTTHPYPALTIEPEAAEDGAEYFGSFFDVYDAQEAIDTLSGVWKTPLCLKSPLPGKPCLYHSIGKCSGPCAGKIDPSAYRADIEEIMKLLGGGRVPSMDRLAQEFQEHMRNLAFEKAAIVHENLESLEKLRKKSQKWFRIQENQDAIVLVRAYRAAECILFVVRQGRVVSRTFLSMGMGAQEKDALIQQSMSATPFPPMEEWVSRCVSDVFADKRFMLMSSLSGGKDALLELVNAFCGSP